MTPYSEDVAVLQEQVRHLRYAAATTTCRVTAQVLTRLLGEAEERLRVKLTSQGVR